MQTLTHHSNPVDFVGVGFKPTHYQDILNSPNEVGWLEIHAENYMIDGGPRMEMMRDLVSRFPISVHGVGMSIGSEEGIDNNHLNRLKSVLDWVNPFQFSEHLAWSSHDCAYLNDLLPLPYTDATLQRISEHIDKVQQYLGRKMLLENPSTYLHFDETTYTETDFLAEIVHKTGCGLLLDINNVFISAHNQGYSDKTYIDNFPLEAVGEIHLGGHEFDGEGDHLVIIDSHNHEVANPVWQLFDYCLEKTGPIITLIEWDADIPQWPVLSSEIQKAASVIATHTKISEYA